MLGLLDRVFQERGQWRYDGNGVPVGTLLRQIPWYPNRIHTAAWGCLPVGGGPECEQTSHVEGCQAA